MTQRSKVKATSTTHQLPGQVVLVLQGGGALGAYQAGVYRALHEAGIEPDWIIGTSIGAINGALIAGNPAELRLDRLDQFWTQVQSTNVATALLPRTATGSALGNLTTLTRGIDGFFTPNNAALWNLHAELGPYRAAFYDTAPLRDTLEQLIDFQHLGEHGPRLSVGAVKVRSGEMCYFDTRTRQFTAAHIMASGALPPAFPAIEIDGEPYWDGGIYSNTPIEAVFDDHPRLDSVIFAVQVWNPGGDAPDSLWEVFGRQKEIQYASRAASHIGEQQRLHRLRHTISELQKRLPKALRNDPEIGELCSWGCNRQMHVIRLLAPRISNEDHTKDIDFTQEGINARREAGYADTRLWLEREPWLRPVDPKQGVLIHEEPAIAGTCARC